MNYKNILYLLLSFSMLSSPVMAADGGDDGDTPAAAGALPDGLAGNYLSGQFARNSGDVDQAIYYLQRVHQDAPEDLTVARQLQGMLLLQSKVDAAFTVAEDIVRVEPKDQLSGLLLTLRDIKAGKYDQASRRIDSVVPDTGGVQLWQPLISAWLDVALHRMQKPMQVEALSADITRAAPLVNYHLALIHEAAGFKKAAAQNYKNAVDDPKDPPVRIMKLMTRFYNENGQPEILKPIVTGYKQANPDFDVSDAPRIATPQDGAAEILFTMGGVMLAAGITNDAAIYLQLALYEKPELYEAAIGLGDTYGELQQYELANQSYARIPPESKSYGKAQLHIAGNYDRMGKTDDAMALLDRLSQQAPKDWDALIMKGDLLRIHQRYADAVDAYSAALERAPQRQRQWPVLFARAACYERQGKWDDAEKDLKQALALKPDQPDVLNYLGYGWLERGKNIAQARDMITKAVKARPDDAQIVDSMGWALYLSGDYAKAVEYLEKAVELLPGDPSVNDHLGDAYWRLGRKTEARFQWERAQSFNPDAKLNEAIERKLKDGLPTNVATSSPATADDATP